MQRKELPTGTAELSAALNEAGAIVQPSIDEAHAVFNTEPLPSVTGDTSQIAHIFQTCFKRSEVQEHRAQPRDSHLRQAGLRAVDHLRC